jgi:hypothetical protein
VIWTSSSNVVTPISSPVPKDSNELSTASVATVVPVEQAAGLSKARRP